MSELPDPDANRAGGTFKSGNVMFTYYESPRTIGSMAAGIEPPISASSGHCCIGRRTSTHDCRNREKYFGWLVPPDTPSAASSWSGTRQVLYSITKHARRRSADEIGATSISFRPKAFSDPASVVD